jgi:DNA-binding NarL/FixJ family response regulator
VFIVDDHAPTLAHVVRALEREFTVVGAVADAASLIADWPAARPDVLVLDVALRDESGFEAMDCVRGHGCAAAVVFLSVHEGPEMVQAAWAAGGIGYVAKRDLGSDLVPAIHAALRGERFVSAAIDAH